MKTRPRLQHLVLWVAVLALSMTSAAGQTHRDWSYNLSLYEVNVRQYTPEGTFAAFSTHLDRLQDMGVRILWIMPIHPIGQENRLGGLGSYYSVRDYLDVNPEFGTLDDFKALVQEIHDRGMYVIMDWVANHTAWDNPLTIDHPEWYVTDTSGNFIPPPGTNWSDVIELDYSQRGLRDYMIDAMRFWVEEVGVDGFRCDAVSFVPDDFWTEAITELKAVRPDLLMLAEGDGRRWHDAGFDMTFGWGLYGFGGGVLKRIADGADSVPDFSLFVEAENVTYSDGEYRLYFTSNHDENSWHGTTTELFGDASEVFAALTATISGMPLIYSGQEAGLDTRLLFFDKDLIPWRDHPNANLYLTLLQLKRDNEALWNGRAGGAPERILTTDNSNVYAFARSKDEDKILAIANLSDQPRGVSLLGSRFPGTYADVFTGATSQLTNATVFSLPAWGYRVFATTPTNTASAAGGVPLPASAVAFPNPFATTLTIEYTLSAPANVTLTVYDLLGREVRALTRGPDSAGRHRVQVEVKDLSPGPYVYRLKVGNRVITRSLTLAR